ncbi:MAG: PKD domain-containing protein [Methanobacteriota archaeon]|nr:MAG: PKD domain-containing protein [Euryarchaeota archaeon]
MSCKTGKRSSIDRSLARVVLLVVVVASLLTTTATRALAPAPDVTPPIANAGPDQTVNEDVPVAFDGSGSTDNVGVVNYTWALPAATSPARPVVSVSIGGAAAFDPVRPLLYLLGSRNVSVVNLTTGSVDRVFPLNHVPTYPMSLTVAPRGAYMAVGIPFGERGYYFFGPFQSYVATFDLVTQTKIGEFFIDEDVYRTLVTDDGYAIVAGGSGQWSALHMMNARNGTVSPQTATIWQYSSVALHPSETRLYSLEDDGLYPPSVHRFDFVPGLGFTGGYDWPYFGTYPGTPLWVSRDLILTGGGYLLTSRDNASDDMQSAGRLPGGYASAVFDSSLGLIAVSTGNGVAFYDIANFAFLGSQGFPGYAAALRFRGSELLVLEGADVVAIDVPRVFQYGVTTSYVFPDPGIYSVTLTVRDAAGNSGTDAASVTVLDVTPPVAHAGPDQSVDEGAFVTLDGSASADNVGITQYSWSFIDGVPQTLYGTIVSYQFQHVGTFVVTLSVTDGANWATDSVTIVVNRDRVPPAANAGPDRVVYEGGLVSFDGSQSTDNLGIASLTWTFLDGSTQVLYGSRPSYRFMNAGTYVITLTVTDVESNTATDTLTVSVRDVSLVAQERPAGFRIGVPAGWDVAFDAYAPGIGPADLVATDRAMGGATVAVSSRFTQVQDTDDYRLAAARSMLASLQNQYGYYIVIGEPKIVSMPHARAAVFEVNLTGPHLRQTWAVFVSVGYQRVLFVVGSADSDSFEAYRPVFDAAIASAEVLRPPEPAQTMAIVLVAVLGLTIGPLVGILAWLSYRARRAPVPRPVGESSAAAVMNETRGAASAETGAPLSPTPWPRFCPRCGLPSAPQGTFCGRCGFKLR